MAARTRPVHTLAHVPSDGCDTMKSAQEFLISVMRWGPEQLTESTVRRAVRAAQRQGLAGTQGHWAQFVQVPTLEECGALCWHILASSCRLLNPR
jgi:hypothetical protein